MRTTWKGYVQQCFSNNVYSPYQLLIFYIGCSLRMYKISVQLSLRFEMKTVCNVYVHWTVFMTVRVPFLKEISRHSTLTWLRLGYWGNSQGYIKDSSEEPYDVRLSKLTGKLLTLEKRRFLFDATFLFNALNGYKDVHFSNFWIFIVKTTETHFDTPILDH